MKRKMPRLTNEGFTIPEVLIATLILLPLFAGVMLVFMRCMHLNELAYHSSQAVRASMNKMTEIDNTDYTLISGTYNNATFTETGLTGRGVTYVDSSQVDILEVKTLFCWQEKNGRIIGEDLDLDGVLDGGEDVNGNGQLDSPAQITTLIYNI